MLTVNCPSKRDEKESEISVWRMEWIPEDRRTRRAFCFVSCCKQSVKASSLFFLIAIFFFVVSCRLFSTRLSAGTEKHHMLSQLSCCMRMWDESGNISWKTEGEKGRRNSHISLSLYVRNVEPREVRRRRIVWNSGDEKGERFVSQRLFVQRTRRR